jgi:quinol-cytochrome oxidoreductase complex cytochrome b subunit
LLPFILSALIIVHLISLHITGSNIPTGINPNKDKTSFHPYYSVKDSIGVVVYIIIVLTFSIIFPYDMGDPENFNPANPLRTPIHIQPE